MTDSCNRGGSLKVKEIMENLDLKQMSAMVDIIAEEKGLPRRPFLA